MWKILLFLIFLFGLTQIETVKIGVSKPSSTTTSSPLTSSTLTSTTINVETTTLSSEDYESTTMETKKPVFEWEPPTLPSKNQKTSTTIKPEITTEPSKEELNQTSNNSTGEFIKAQPHTAQQHTKYSISNFCFCNMHSNCDVNCCCDPDCSAEALKVFNCNDKNKNIEENYLLQDFQYQHGLPSCKVNDGWFCVFRTNTKQHVEKVY